MKTFRAQIDIIGINPHVLLPEEVLQYIFKQAKKDKGSVPVRITVDGHAFTQTLVRYSGAWRLYLNQPMRTAAGKEVGDVIEVGIAYDPVKRTLEMHPQLSSALNSDQEAKQIFDSLSPSLQQEIIRYISRLKTVDSVERNVARAIAFLHGKERFIGRDRP